MLISGATAPVQYTDVSGNPVAVTSANPLPTSGGGGGSGSLLSDVLLTDNTGALFVGRDNGTTVTYFNLNTNAVYAPTGTIVAAPNTVSVTGTVTATNPSVGTNLAVAPTSSTLIGFSNRGFLDQVDSANPLPVTDLATVSAKTSESPQFVAITGDPSGDFAGINLLEQAMTDGTGLQVNVKEQFPPLKDVRGAAIPSDAPANIILFLGVNSPQTIDTTGYQSVAFQQTAAVAVTVTQSNDGVNFTAAFGIINSAINGTFTSATAATAQAIYTYPVACRYMRFSAATQTSLNVYLRQTSFASYHQLGALGINITNIGGTANASQAGTLTLGTTAATNGMTLGTLVAPLTVAATVVKASAGKLYSMSVGNAQTTAVYLKIYNATAVTLGTTSPIQNFLVPGGTAGGAFNLDINDVGLYFSTGICFAVTGGQALLDSTALTTAAVVNYSFI